MATTTWNASKDQTAANKTSDNTNYGSGVDIHMAIGYISWLPGWARGYVGFSYSWTGWTAINSATLYLRSDDGYHASHGSSPTLYFDLVTASWSEAGGTGETWTTSGYISPAVSTTNRVTATIGASNDTWYSVNITGLIQQAFSNGAFYGIRIMSSNEGSTTGRTGFWTTEKGSSYDAYIVVDYSTNTAPNAPTGLTPTGDTILNSLTPTFAGTFSDPDAGDTMSGYQTLLYADDGTTLIWDSGAIAATGTTFSKVYTGAALTGNTFYRWQGRTKDASGTWGAYSAQQRFKVNSVPNAPSIALQESPTTDVKTLTPTFLVTHSDPDASDSSLYGYHIILETSGGTSVWDSGDVASTATVTTSVTYSGPALSWQTGYRWRARTKDSNGAWGAYSSNATFTTHTAGVPIGLDPTGGEIASSITPTFVGSRATTADSLTSAQIKVYASDGVTLVWDSGTFTTGVTSTGFSEIYSGTALASATTYKWQARITSSVGGTSAYSALQTFVTPDTNTPNGTAPVGSGITPVTSLSFDFNRTASFNRHELYVYQSDGTTLVTSDTPVAYTATTSKSFVYGGTLAWNTTYKWKVRVSSDGGTNWSPFTGLITFTTDSAGVPTLNTPTDSAWLGAPNVIDEYDDITGVTNGTSASSALETTIFQTGIGSLKIAIAALAASGSSFTYRAVTKNLSGLGAATPGSIYVYASSLTNISTMRLRFQFATSGDYAEYNVIPSGTGAWELKTFTKGSPTATAGTVDWSNVTAIGIRVVATGGGSVTSNIYIDDLKFDSTAPSFDGTTYNSEVISTFQVRVYASDQTTLVWDSGDTAGSGTTFSVAYGGSALSRGSTYYWQARYVKSTGPTGNYSGMQPFVLNSDPSIPSATAPATGYVLADSLIPQFTATFNDVDKTTQGDAPTYMEVEVYRNSDSVLAYRLLTKTGLVAASNTIYDGLAGTVKVTGAAAPLAYETEYKWRVRYYDSKGARGTWSSYSTIKPSQSPTATISSPIDTGTVTSPSFTVTWGMSSPGSKVQNSYRVRIIRSADAVALIDTGRVYSSATSYIVPTGYLVNLTAYAIELTLWDTDSLTGTDTNNVTSNWTAPDPIQNFVVATDENLSATVMHWDQSNLLPAEFRNYTIYRKLSTASTWDILETLTDIAAVTYNDYTAANTVSYDYKITQFQIVPGDVDLESADSDIGTVVLDTDSWFVVGADRSASHIFEVPVTAAPFTEPVQQEVFEPLGTSRKVIVRGRVMGAEGTLQGQWNTTDRDTALAQVAYIKSNAGPHVLKSPFGDVWLVEFSGPNKDYVSGGHVTISINWTEVA